MWEKGFHSLAGGFLWMKLSQISLLEADQSPLITTKLVTNTLVALPVCKIVVSSSVSFPGWRLEKFVFGSVSTLMTVLTDQKEERMATNLSKRTRSILLSPLL